MKQYQITLNGHQFSVSSEYGEDHIRQVENFLNDRIERVAAKCDCFNVTTLAYLVSLNLADELFSIRENPEIQQEVVKKKLHQMNEELENLLISAPDAIQSGEIENEKQAYTAIQAVEA